MRAILAAALLAAMALAGCADSGSSTAPDEDIFDDVETEPLDDGKGLIRGVVLEVTIIPIANATVKILGEGSTQQTTAKGAFYFTNLEPGTYFLEVSKVGYNTTQASAVVVAGELEPAVVKIILPSNPSSLPRVVPYTWDGFIFCSVRTPAIGMPCTQGMFGDDDIDERYELDTIPHWAQGEMDWESTQALGGEMSYNWRKTGTNRDYIDVEGRAPLVLQADMDLLAANDVGDGQPLRQIIFTAHLEETEPPVGGLWGVGLQIDQKFSVYTHVFYNWVPDPEWRFLVDGAPELPG